MEQKCSDLITILAPSKNEAENLKILIEEIETAMGAFSFELLIIDDGSTDNTLELVTTMAQSRSWLHCLSLSRSAGKSAAIREGIRRSTGSIIVTIDADGQNNPAYIPELVQALDNQGSAVGLIGGQRLKRSDNWLKRKASRIANKIRGSMLNDRTRDSGCGFLAIRRTAFESLPYFDGRHRFMAALVLREGYQIGHIDVIDRPRRYGESKYGIFDRGVKGTIDLLGVWWLLKRSPKPFSVEEIS